MPRVFISYKRADKDKVFPLKEKIEAAIGEPCWIDLDGIESDAQFERIIINAINQADIFLFMYSNLHTKINYDDDWTLKEIMFAELKKKRIVFVNLDNSPLTDWFLWKFGSKQQINVNSSEAFERLIIDIQKWLGKGYAKKQLLEESPVVQQHVIGKLPNLKANTMNVVSRTDDKETDVWLKSKSTYSGLKGYAETYSHGKYIKKAKLKIILYKIFVLPIMIFNVFLIITWPLIISGIILGLDLPYGTECSVGFLCFFIVYLIAFNIIMGTRNQNIKNGKSHWIEPVIIKFKRLFRF